MKQNQTEADGSLKVLLIHNKYGVVSGEEIMISRITKLLESKHHEVRVFIRGGEKLESLSDKVSAFCSGLWSFSARRELSALVEEFDPDIVQIQNLYPEISPSILPVLRSAGVPIVMRLSNYRLVCPSGLLLSKGEVCSRCLGGKEYWCVLRNCEDSLFKSLGYALRNYVARHFGLYQRNVTQYYAQTSFQKDVIASDGYSSAAISVIPNMVELAADDGVFVRGEYVGFVGRLSKEKGIDVLFDAAKMLPTIPFKIAGDLGEYGDYNELPGNVELLGHLRRDALESFYRQSRFIVVPSLWYEGFPGVIIEAMRHRKPVVASRIGGLPEIVDDGVTGRLFNVGDSASLFEVVSDLWDNSEMVEKLGQAGKSKVESEFSSDLYYDRLMAVYERAMAAASVEAKNCS